MNEGVYLDYNATTPVDPRVLQEFIPYVTEIVGNAASEHAAGRRVRDAVEAARSKIAASIGASASTIVFTSGATESINLALKGALLRSKTQRRKVVTFATEHKAVLDTCDWLRSQGMQVDVVAVTRDGVPDLEAASQAIDEQTALVSVMAANNETGVLGPVEDIVSLSHRVGALVHCDATQALGKVPLDVEDLAVDFASISSHKIYGPTGVGALFVRHGKDAGLVPLIHGGGHERGLRSGTLNSAGIVGFGAAPPPKHSEHPTSGRRCSSRASRNAQCCGVDRKCVHSSEPRPVARPPSDGSRLSGGTGMHSVQSWQIQQDRGRSSCARTSLPLAIARNRSR